jgi:hypothetical protein
MGFIAALRVVNPAGKRRSEESPGSATAVPGTLKWLPDINCSKDPRG